MLRPLPNVDELLLLGVASNFGVKVELGLCPNELLVLPEERPTVVRVLLWRVPKLELLRVLCCVLELLPKLLLEVLELRRAPKLTRFP